jgi:hypothetical protein
VPVVVGLTTLSPTRWQAVYAKIVQSVADRPYWFPAANSTVSGARGGTALRTLRPIAISIEACIVAVFQNSISGVSLTTVDKLEGIEPGDTG